MDLSRIIDTNIYPIIMVVRNKHYVSRVGNKFTARNKQWKWYLRWYILPRWNTFFCRIACAKIRQAITGFFLLNYLLDLIGLYASGVHPLGKQLWFRTYRIITQSFVHAFSFLGILLCMMCGRRICTFQVVQSFRKVTYHLKATFRYMFKK